MRMRFAAALVFGATVALTGCAQHEETSGAQLSPAVWPTPQVAKMNDAPIILAVDLSPSRVAPGAWWKARIVTSTNVASVEVRWPFFAFSVPRRAPGEFSFSFHVVDLPVIYRRPYTVEIVARNTRGTTTQRNVVTEF